MDKSYHSYGRNDVLALVGAHAPATTLDVGCGAGSFSELLKSSYGSITWGIEPDLSSYRSSLGVLDNALVGNWEDCYSSLPLREFDAIFFNDVLEHMVSPELCLSQAADLLAPGGRIFASIPNFLFADNLFNIVFSRDWRYEDSGILDRTHLRFYTKKSMIRLFRDAGFSVDKIEPLSSARGWKWRLLISLSGGFLREFSVYQYGIVASPTV
jgi:2-polyprenyl-3-methyl-5-hydroxy-6-metoxy-1,4-benzoquinol methylase